jgi:hypothetical protein
MISMDLLPISGIRSEMRRRRYFFEEGECHDTTHPNRVRHEWRRCAAGWHET